MRQCGTKSGYNGGCRCDDCRRAARDDQRRRRGIYIPPLNAQGWRRDAACRRMGPDLFYPVSDSHSQLEARWAQDRAVAVCRTCPVTDPCLADALARGDEHGIWGATTPDDRQNLRRLRKRLRNREAG